MRITLPRPEWRRIVKALYDDPRFIQELNDITYAATETKDEEFAVELDVEQAKLMGEATGCEPITSLCESILLAIE